MISVLRLIDYKKGLLECLVCLSGPKLLNVSNPFCKIVKVDDGILSILRHSTKLPTSGILADFMSYFSPRTAG